MVQRLLLHIGHTKTGTTSLQQYLSDNYKELLKQGVIYPKMGRGKSLPAAHHNLAYETGKNYLELGRYSPSQGGWDSVLKEINSSDAGTAIISAEGYIFYSRDDIHRLAERVSGLPVEVIVYLRRQDLWLQSQWNQKARFGRADLNFHRFLAKRKTREHYDQRLEPWIEVFGKSKVKLGLYGNSGSSSIDSFFYSFLPNIKKPRSEGIRKNTKAGLKHIIAMSDIQLRCRELFGLDFRIPNQFSMKLSNYFRNRGDITKYSVLTIETARETMEYFRESNNRLFTMLGVQDRFPEPDTADFPNPVDLTKMPDTLDSEERKYVNKIVDSIIKDQSL